MKYGNFKLGQIEALFNILGGEEAVKLLLQRREIAQRVRDIIVGGPSLTMMTLLVSYSNPRWKTIVPTDYREIGKGITIDDFPVTKRGRKSVEFVFVPTMSTSVRRVLEDTLRFGLRTLERAEAETFLRKNLREREGSSIAALCNATEEQLERHSKVACILASRRGVALQRRSIGYDQFSAYTRYLAAKREDVPSHVDSHA